MPRRSYDNVSLFDKLVFTFGAIGVIPITVISCLARRLWTSSDYRLRDDIFLACVRRLKIVPLSIRRKLATKGDNTTILSSRRLSGASLQLYKKLSRSDFAGYWICRGSVHGLQRRPSESDVTLVWLHGGAYITGTALSAGVSLLRIAEAAAEQGISVNVFSLEYSLAPEAQFPSQLDEATAAYRFLVEEEKIHPAKIMVLGESAGGHLALSLTYNLQRHSLSRPGKLVLISPWVNLENSGTSFAASKYKDSLDKPDLDRCVNRLMGGSDGLLKFAEYVNFASPLSTLNPSADGCSSWSEALPPSWVIIGENDVFLSDVSSFVANASDDGVQVDFHVEPGKPHGWFGYRDALRVKEYLGLSPTEDAGSILRSSEELANVVCDHARAYRTSSKVD
ncbi:Alpha/Beta hydrolase protein [Aspergillus spectabilis]